MDDIFRKIAKFNYHIVGVDPDTPIRELPPKDKTFLVEALHEELAEFQASDTGANSSLDRIVDQIDALTDGCIFAIGGMIRMGLSPEQIRTIFNIVMGHNFLKKAGANLDKPRNTGAKDAVKPEGWIGPEADIRKLLMGEGFKGE